MLNAKATMPKIWEDFLTPYLNISEFYKNLSRFLVKRELIMPKEELIFNIFTYMEPGEVCCVLYGEDPYPRINSAYGVAFWDKEIESWEDKTNGNSLKNILKSLLVHKELADYNTPIKNCRIIAKKNNIRSPKELFELWLNNGVLLINSAMTFSDKNDKKEHFLFWQPFHKALIKALNKDVKPFYILWGKKAQQWEIEILKGSYNKEKIIKQGHPTFIHQFLDKDRPNYSPFNLIAEKTAIEWI